jgi:hypothetical protein
LFSAEAVVSVVDFAETRRGFIEEDIAALVSELPALHEPLIASFEKLSRSKINARCLRFSLAMKEFFNCVISDRLGDVGSSAAAEVSLRSYLRMLEGA